MRDKTKRTARETKVGWAKHTFQILSLTKKLQGKHFCWLVDCGQKQEFAKIQKIKIHINNKDNSEGLFAMFTKPKLVKLP